MVCWLDPGCGARRPGGAAPISVLRSSGALSARFGRSACRPVRVQNRSWSASVLFSGRLAFELRELLRGSSVLPSCRAESPCLGSHRSILGNSHFRFRNSFLENRSTSSVGACLVSFRRRCPGAGRNGHVYSVGIWGNSGLMRRDVIDCGALPR